MAHNPVSRKFLGFSGTGGRLIPMAALCGLLAACAAPVASTTEESRKAAAPPLPQILLTTSPLPPHPPALPRPRPRPRIDPNAVPPQARPLLPLFEALRDLETGVARGPVTILHLGDSHTAGDRFSGRLRALFQERFGAAGRGGLAPGKPFKGFRPTQVGIQATPGWKVASSFDASAGGVFGLSGFRLRSASPDDRMRLDSATAEGFDLVEVEVLMQPRGGTFRMTVDERPQGVFTTVADSPQVGVLRLPVPDGSRSVELRPLGSGPVDVLSWATQREKQSGIIYESHGIVGATINIIDRWDPAVTTWEIAHRAPALIVVAFGTNEGFNDKLSAERYTTDFEARLDFLRRAAPDAAILVVGAPDAQRLSAKCSKAAKAPQELPCGSAHANKKPPVASSRKWSQFVRSCRWSVPVNLGMTRTIQKNVSAQQGYYFWDWSHVMNGTCGMHEWVNRSPPLAHGDHVHMQAEGYAVSAEALFADLMALYTLAPIGK